MLLVSNSGVDGSDIDASKLRRKYHLKLETPQTTSIPSINLSQVYLIGFLKK